MDLTIDQIVDRTAFAEPGDGRDVQIIQTAYRAQLAGMMEIRPGDRIFEIACGQGDMTAVLASAVGKTGRVTAVDIADPSYGMPVTLGDAMAAIQSSELGGRIDVHFRTDLLDLEVKFGAEAFDLAVLAHGAWYFATPGQLEETLRRVSTWTKRLALAEWDLQPTEVDQTPHLLAIILQGMLGAFTPNSIANVRIPMSRQEMIALVERAGWTVEQTYVADTTGLQDGGWEVGMADLAMEEADLSQTTAATNTLIRSLHQTMKSAKKEAAALPAYQLICNR